MAIEYLGLSEVNGPLVVLEGVKNASYEEIVEFTVDGNEKKLGRIVAVYEDKAVIQVFEGTSSMSLTNTHTRLTGHPMEIGITNVQTVSYTVPVEESIRIKTRSIMGVEIPLVEAEPSGQAPTYAYYSTKESLDQARQAFEKVKDLTLNLSMIENSAYRLAAAIKKTQKRANALKNITIPHYTQLSKDIADALEEKEREEFTRLKVIKQRKNKAS